MQRYFTAHFNITTNSASLIGDDFHHIKNVMRSKVNDTIIVCDLNGNCYSSLIENITANEVHVRLTEQLPNYELNVKVDLAQSLIRREKFEYVLQKATELGVYQIIPLNAKHSIIQLESKKQDKKMERWNKITKEASEQSHRNHLVTVSNIVEGVRNLPFHVYDSILVAYEKEHLSTHLRTELKAKPQRILLLVGPEGGFHTTEIDFLSTIENVKFVGLGKRILRSETASSFLLSTITYEYEMDDES